MSKYNDRVNDNKESCSHYIIRVLEEANHALCYQDFGGTFAYGTLRNTLSKKCKKGKILKLPKENPARFILPNWNKRPEYSCIQRNDKECKVGKFDFLSFLENLPWSSNLCIHNLKLTFNVYNFHWIDHKVWKYCKNESYQRYFSLSLPVYVQCYDTGTVLVSIKCSSIPFSLNIDGLFALSNLLGEIRNVLHAPCIPDPSSWVIVQWHLNRDSEPIEISGLDFHITFKDFFNNLARVYTKHEINRIRVEVNQSPNRICKEVFEEILNRDNTPKGGS